MLIRFTMLAVVLLMGGCNDPKWWSPGTNGGARPIDGTNIWGGGNTAWAQGIRQGMNADPSSTIAGGNTHQAWIRENADGGRMLVMSDGTVWEVSSLDRVKSQLWLGGSTVTMFSSGDYPYNVSIANGGESVKARRMR